MESLAAVVFFILTVKYLFIFKKNKFYFFIVSCFCIYQSEGIE